jgi:hypothetical protein
VVVVSAIDSITLRSGTGRVGEIKGEIIFETDGEVIVKCGEYEYHVPRRLIENIERALPCGWTRLCPGMAIDLEAHAELGTVPICRACRKIQDERSAAEATGTKCQHPNHPLFPDDCMHPKPGLRAI